MDHPIEMVLSATDLANYLKINRGTVLGLRSRGLPLVRISNRKYFIHVDDFINWLRKENNNQVNKGGHSE